MRKLTVVFALLAVAASLVFVSTASAASFKFATLSGAAEVPPGAGDLDGSGTAVVAMDPRRGAVCWDIAVSGIGTIILAHIHNAPAGQNGPIVVDFFGQLTGCTFASPSLLTAIAQNPDQYYVNVHTTEFPAGAVRGQLFTVVHR
jgi:CHRD domain